PDSGRIATAVIVPLILDCLGECPGRLRMPLLCTGGRGPPLVADQRVPRVPSEMAGRQLPRSLVRVVVRRRTYVRHRRTARPTARPNSLVPRHKVARFGLRVPDHRPRPLSRAPRRTGVWIRTVPRLARAPELHGEQRFPPMVEG